uniref:Heparanase-like protein 1 n=1 Tax=Elaeis guineensis var. tenera TaxID=51953 RepID=A0A8N4EWP5_ELAGV|nr:heparanase-like protein 1 [Elaeis guineensis]
MGVPFCFLSILLFSSFSLGPGNMATVSVKAVTKIAKTDINFICATIDWWPKEKCNYNMSPWYNSSIINLDLNNTILFNAVKAFKCLRIRLGGTLQDRVVYKVGRKPVKCENFKLDQNELLGFTTGCLNKSRWDELNAFFNKTGAIITFGLNALNGRKKAPEGNLYIGDWDSTNARKFIRYTVKKNYKIEAWEFGNEVSGRGIGASVDAKQYGKDLIALKKLINRLYRNSSTQQKLLAPGGFFEAQWYAEMLQTSGSGVVDAVTHHIYNLGAGVDKELIHKIQNPYYSSRIVQTYNDILTVIKDSSSWSSTWVGEAGGAYNSGGKDVSNTFANSFWYLDQLGMVSTFKHKVFCRQALIGGNYALLDTTTFIPNPDFYSALLWHRLMGPGVLHATHDSSPFLRSYAHCSRERPGITVLLINLSNSASFDVTVSSDLNLYPNSLAQSLASVTATGHREEYHLTSQRESRRRRTAGDRRRAAAIPEMKPVIADSAAPLHVAPHSVVFARFKDIKAPAC